MNIEKFEEEYTKKAQDAELLSGERLGEFTTAIANEFLKKVLGITADQIEKLWEDDDFMDVILDVLAVDVAVKVDRTASEKILEMVYPKPLDTL